MATTINKLISDTLCLLGADIKIVELMRNCEGINDDSPIIEQIKNYNAKLIDSVKDRLFNCN